MENVKLSESLGVLATINPSSQAAGAAASGWISMANAERLLALIMVGTFGAAATVDASIQQAQDATGTGAKAIGSGKAITTLQAAGGNNVQATIDLRAEELDSTNGFDYVQLTVTVGTAATETAAVLIAGETRYEPASVLNAASVVQQVG
ncbi:MAG: hypothetical protein M0T84_17070 [Betaproteobacteria bacterium]|nr:hypothetical protein [Betaproteobacteria bacterium]